MAPVYINYFTSSIYIYLKDPPQYVISRGRIRILPSPRHIFSDGYLHSIFFTKIWYRDTRGNENCVFEAILTVRIFEVKFELIP